MDEFKTFAMRGNVIDMAVGIIIGAAFGKIIEGMDVVNEIAETPVDWNDRPMEDQVIKTMSVETFGETYPEPETL